MRGEGCSTMRFRWKCAGKGMAIGMAIRMTVFSICVTIEHTYIECYYFIADRLNAPTSSHRYQSRVSTL